MNVMILYGRCTVTFGSLFLTTLTLNASGDMNYKLGRIRNRRGLL